MPGGYMNRFLFVNLSDHVITEETPGENVLHDFLGGYGLGARVLYSRQQPGADALGPGNTLGFVTGPLTGTPTPFGCRFAVVGKSPLTSGWGDANCGGFFGPYLKFAGYDAVFVTGVADEPVFLLIDNGKAEIRSAAHLWGKGTHETEETLEAEIGRGARVMSIGPSGEALALVSCIMTNRGSAAGRSGLGAVMGSKKLKAVVVRGDMKVPLADPEAVDALRKRYMADLNRVFIERFRAYGTSSHADISAHSGDTPIKNWEGIGVIDLPDVSGLNKDIVNAHVAKRSGCWRCPAACRATLEEGTEYNYPAGTHRPEYETLGAFGANCLNTSAESIAMLNHICNDYGLDTISAGTIISFAMECYEKGIITQADTDGIDLTWGNHRAIVAMTEKMVRREGLGDILADGVKKAAEKLGKGAEQCAVHIGGQELGMHDPKSIGGPGFHIKPPAALYQMDATPGRHTGGFGPTHFRHSVLNAVGLCMHSGLGVKEPWRYLLEFLNTISGWDRSPEEIIKTGERIATMRHVFGLREGDNPLDRVIHRRILGRPPQADGPLAGVTLDAEAQAYWNLGAMDWDRKTTRPSRRKLLELNMEDVADDLWPPQEGNRPGDR